MGGDVIILEEAAYINPKVFSKVVIPLMMMKFVVVIAISSPSDETNYCSQLAQVRNKVTGEKIFHLLSIGVSCENCQLYFPGQECEHVYKPLPDHRSAKNLVIAESLLGDDQDTIRQELYGEANSGSLYMLRTDVRRFQLRMEEVGPYQFTQQVQVLHSAIDPSGGGRASDWSILTMARENGQHVLVGIDVHTGREDNMDYVAIQAMLKAHYTALFSQPRYANAKVWLYMEVVSDRISPQIWCTHLETWFPGRFHYLRRIQNAPEQIGIVTTNHEKQNWSVSMRELMFTDTLHYAQDMVSSSDVSKLKAMLEDQLSRWCKLTEPAKTIFAEPRVTYGAKAGGLKDDLACAFGILVRQIRARLVDADFHKYCDDHGIVRF